MLISCAYTCSRFETFLWHIYFFRDAVSMKSAQLVNILAAPWENQQSAWAKTKAQISFAVTAKLIRAFVFATRIVQFHFCLKPKFQASSYLLCLYRPVCVGPVRKPHCWFSHEEAHFTCNIKKMNIYIQL